MDLGARATGVGLRKLSGAEAALRGLLVILRTNWLVGPIVKQIGFLLQRLGLLIVAVSCFHLVPIAQSWVLFLVEVLVGSELLLRSRDSVQLPQIGRLNELIREQVGDARALVLRNARLRVYARLHFMVLLWHLPLVLE